MILLIRKSSGSCEQIGLKEALELEESLKKKFVCKIRHSFNTFEFWAYPL